MSLFDRFRRKSQPVPDAQPAPDLVKAMAGIAYDKEKSIRSEVGTLDLLRKSGHFVAETA